MKKQRPKETPLFNVTKEEIIQLYNFIYAYLLDLKKRKGHRITRRHKAAVNEPSWACAEIIYLALYGYTKKTKFSKTNQYLRWPNPKPDFKKRVMHLLGPEAQYYVKQKEKELLGIRVERKIPPEEKAIVNTISYELKTTNMEIQSRMQKYIDDFDLHSSIDLDILRNLVQTQLLIEVAHKALAEGKHSSQDLKSLSLQLKEYASLLGLSKKDRVDFGSERKKGSIAELASTYEETLREYPTLEQEFLIDELNMLIDKHERLNDDGERELSIKAFRTISGGYTMEEARSMTGRKRKYVKKSTPNP